MSGGALDSRRVSDRDRRIREIRSDLEHWRSLAAYAADRAIRFEAEHDGDGVTEERTSVHRSKIEIARLEAQLAELEMNADEP